MKFTPSVTAARHFSRSRRSAGNRRPTLWIAAFFTILAGVPSLMVAAENAPRRLDKELGLQLYSLRAQAKHNPLAALDLVTKYGLVDVETAGTGDMTATAYAKELRKRGLRAVSAHFSYDQLEKDLDRVIADATALGVRYVVVPSLKHENGVFDADLVAANFERWGARLRQAGLLLGYHPHGFEFRPLPDGSTRFDVLATRTRPENLCFEIDVFWVVHAGVDPVALMEKYPDRWRLMHVKDLRKGAPTGTHTGRAPATDNTVVGQGQIDWPRVLRTARQQGVVHFLVEDETVSPLESIPASLDYLRNLDL
jgi:sugar phosphate isomerase/epimerase